MSASPSPSPRKAGRVAASELRPGDVVRFGLPGDNRSRIVRVSSARGGRSVVVEFEPGRALLSVQASASEKFYRYSDKPQRRS